MNHQFFIFASLLTLVIFESSSVIAQDITSTPAPNVNTTSPAPSVNTTSPAPNVTISSPAPSANATSPAPTSNTTTPEAITTTAPPATTTPDPDPINTYSVKENNVTCIKMMARIEFDIQYEKKTASGTANTTVHVNLPSNFTTAGTCKGNETEDLVILFNDGWGLNFVFQQDGTSKSDSYHLSTINFKYSTDNFPNSTKTGFRIISKTFGKSTLKANNNGYYVCDSKNTMDLEGVAINIKDLKYQAFNEKGDVEFKSGTVSECSADEDTDSIVPIAVGGALAGLVLIVLIAYLVGRKRTRQSGYESV